MTATSIILILLASIILLLIFSLIFRNTPAFAFKGFFNGISIHIYKDFFKLLKVLHIPFNIISGKLYKKLRNTNPGGNPMEAYEKLIISSISRGLTAYFFIAVFLIIILLQQDSKTTVSSVKRPDFNGVSISEDFMVSIGNDRETKITVTLEPRLLTDTELFKMYTELFETLSVSFIGDNTSLSHIDKKLSFLYSIADETTKGKYVNISWKYDKSLINSDGSLIYDNIDKAGTGTTISATLQMEGYDFTLTKDFFVFLYQRELSAEEILSNEINEYINSTENISAGTVDFPDDSSLGSLEFFKEKEAFPIIIIPLSFTFIILAVCLQFSLLDKKVKSRNNELARDYPEIVSKLSLLYLAGLNIQNAFRRILADYESTPHEKRYVYEEIRTMLKSIDNGAGEAAAYIEFGHNCTHPSYIKLGSLLAQNLRRGQGGIYELLEYEAYVSLQDKKMLIKASSEKASSKAVFPMVLMLSVVFIIVMSPALMSI